MKVIYFGHSAVYIETNLYSIIIDPFLRNNPQCNYKPEDLKKLDYILITHGHSDHLGDAIELSKLYDATIISNFEIINFLKTKGLEKLHSMHIGGSFVFDFGKVKLTNAVHGSSINDGNNIIYGGNPCGFLIQFNGTTFYHAGDTGLTYDMKLLEDYSVDVAFLPVGGNYTMDVYDAIKAIEWIKPNHIVPIHYDTFDIIKADVSPLIEKYGEDKIIVLKPNGEMHHEGQLWKIKK